MKKCLSILLAFLIMCTCAVAAFSLNEADAITDYPVILVPGYSGTELVLVNDDGSKTPVWHLSGDDITARVLARIVDLGKGLINLSTGDAQYIGKVVGEEVINLLSVLKCNPDGTSINNVQIANPSPQETNTAYIRQNGLPEIYIGEPVVYSEIAGYIGEEKCFSFTEDWRMGTAACAKRLDEYIQQVKEYTGKDKVNILAVSHGGQVAATYLSYFGQKRDVDNAVLTVPAIGGAALAYDVMSENIDFDEYELINFLEHGFISEDDYKWLVEAQQLGFLDEVITAIIPYAKTVVTHFGSIWDFIPSEYYDELRDENLDAVANAAIIENSDYFHHVTLPGIGDALTRCNEQYGMNVNIIAGTGNRSVTGLNEYADAILTVKSSTGAKTAPFGKRFSDGYAGTGTRCTDPAHNHISPSLQIDGTYAYMPENTWYVDKLFHGMTFNDVYSKELAIRLLLTDTITDVYSNPAYPQFHASTNASNAVFAAFNNSVEGYVSGSDTSLVITNLSEKYPVKLTSITFAGATMSADALDVSKIAPGESVEVPISGELPEVSRQHIQVSVNYLCIGNLFTPIGKRTFSFTVMNGPAADYDSDSPYAAADFPSGLETALGASFTGLLKRIGVFSFVDMLYDIFSSLISHIRVH